MEIRKYQYDDFCGLKRLVDNTYGTDIRQQVIDKEYNNGSRFIVLAIGIDNNVVGTAFVEKRYDYIRNKRSYFITYVCVDTNYRRQGVGKAIFDKIEEYAREDRINIIELTSANYREGAHRFYESIGFTKKKTTVFINDTFSVC